MAQGNSGTVQKKPFPSENSDYCAPTWIKFICDFPLWLDGGGSGSDNQLKEDRKFAEMHGCLCYSMKNKIVIHYVHCMRNGLDKMYPEIVIDTGII